MNNKHINLCIPYTVNVGLKCLAAGVERGPDLASFKIRMEVDYGNQLLFIFMSCFVKMKGVLIQ